MVGSEAQTIVDVPRDEKQSVSLAATAYDADRPPLPAGASTADSLIGRRIDHFEIRALLGEGGMGSVYLAHDLSLERAVAIKVLRPGLTNNPALIERLKVEARAQARLSHPNVVNVYYIGTFEGSPYFAMEYVRGDTLADRIQKSGQMGWQEALEYIIQTARALAEANQRGIVHRDVKPSNLMLSAVGAQAAHISHVKVADFGLAAPPGLREENIGGSPYYASPEQLAGKPPDHRSDIYSLGVTFHELLTGVPPFEADSLSTITKLHATAPRPTIPARQAPWRLRQLITEMMDPEPSKRPWTYEELLRRLEALRFREAVPGGFVARTMAMGVDAALCATFYAVVGQPVARALGAGTQAGVEAAFALFALYYLVAHRVFGQTFGKRLFRLRIQGTTRAVRIPGILLRFCATFWGPLAALVLLRVDSTSGPGAGATPTVAERLGGPMGWQEMPVVGPPLEHMVGLLWGPSLWLLLVWAVGLTFALFDENRRALHDLLARTRVIYSMREQGPDNSPSA